MVKNSLEFCRVCGSAECTEEFQVRGCAIFRCLDCESLFVARSVSPPVYNEDYFTGDVYASYQNDPAVHKNAQNLLDELSINLLPGSSLFEVGAATGVFMEKAVQRYSAQGVEISPYASEQARNRGLDIQTGTIEDVQGENRFDGIVAWDVLEHLEDPGDFAKHVYRLLKPKGFFLAHTVNIDSAFVKMMGKRWHQFYPPYHLSFFSIRGATMMLHNAELNPVSLTSKGAFRSVGAFAARYFPSIKKLSNFGFNINLGDLMLIVARKP
ncbi:MAG: class I SAM-dependent methyltransferase [Candidatus Lindowbacteria bacterium]|nr:class I SAM-dependent methyltransferase [Candidatus Lindowbacteria bacterium]